MAGPGRTVDFQAGGSNYHYGRIAHWLAAGLTRRIPDLVVNIKVGQPFRDLDAVGRGLASIGVTTPAIAALQCLRGQATFREARPDLQAIGVVPHRDEIVFGAVAELGLESIDDVRERRIPIRLTTPPETDAVGFAAHRAMEEHGLTPASLASWGGQWIDESNAQRGWRMVAEGEADVLVHESVIMAFRPLSKARPIRLLPMRADALEHLAARYGYTAKSTMPGSCVGQDEAVAGLNWDHWIVVAHARLPEDIAYELANVFLTDQVALDRQYTADNRLPWGEHPLDYPIRPEVVATEVTIPLHLGAATRYREAGLSIE